MKRLLLLCTALFISKASLKAQDTTVVNDTLHYFFNKWYFKTATTLTNFPYYKSAFATTTLITHIGSKFENVEPIVVSGIEALISHHEGSTKEVIPVHMYLCNLQNNLPVLPPIDSVVTSVVNITAPSFTNFIGGNFVSGKTYTMNGNFCVLLRNMSLSAGDTVRVGRTGSKTHTNTTVPWTEKVSDGFSYVRYNNQFYSTRDFTVGGGANYPHARNGFGVGTDYEFCIAPRVTYTLVSHHEVGANARNPLCTWEPLVVQNLSSQRFLQRQYNLVEFARYWGTYNPLHPATLIDANNQPVFPQDSSVGWFFSPEDNLFFTPDPRKFLPYNTVDHKMTFITDSSQYKVDGTDSITCFDRNEFRTRFKVMSIYGRGGYMQYNDTFIICTSYCGRPYVVGASERDGLRGVSVFPNPSTGKATITGMKGNVSIKVYDMLGQLVLSEATKSDEVEINLTGYPRGAYLVRIRNDNDERTVRFIRE